MYSEKGKSKKRRQKAIGEVAMKDGEGGGGCCAGPN